MKNTKSVHSSILTLNRYKSSQKKKNQQNFIVRFPIISKFPKIKFFSILKTRNTKERNGDLNGNAGRKVWNSSDGTIGFEIVEIWSATDWWYDPPRSAFSSIHVNFSKILGRIFRMCEKIRSSDNSLMANGRPTEPVLCTN